jgi:large subunit ribosomal protein L4
LYAIPFPERLHVPILDFKSASESGTIHLSEDVFGQDPIRTDILHRCVIYQRNKKRGRRNGGARTKTIGEVSGSGKKVRNQKGGGIARAGHKRPAHWRGGAKAHGPKGSIQNYETKLNKKVRKIGLRMALSQKLKEGNLIIVNSFSDVGTYKTKVLAKTLLDIADIGGKFGSSAYIVDHVVDNEDEDDEEALITSLEGCDINLKVGCANIMRTKVTNQRNVNVYDLLKYDKTVMSLSALAEIEDRYGAI